MYVPYTVETPFTPTLAHGLNGHVGISRSGDDSRKLGRSFFGNSPFQLVCAVQCLTIKNYKYINQHMIPIPNNQKLITW